MPQHKHQSRSESFTIELGDHELVIRRRYQVASILNDFFIGIWFLIGSILFLFASLEDPGIWFFILGSAQLLIRPSIRLARLIHLKKIPESSWET